MNTFRAVVLLLVCASSPAPLFSEESEPHPLLKNYFGKATIPDDLLKTYAAFVKSAREGSPERYCLPQAVTVTRDERAAESAEYGQSMNLPFLKNQFTAEILNARKESDDVFLIRTGTSALWFVQTKSDEWLIYRYLDKPIR